MEVDAAEVFLSGWKRLKDAFIDFFSLNEKEQVQDVHTNHQKRIHTSMYYVIIIYQLDCNGG